MTTRLVLFAFPCLFLASGLRADPSSAFAEANRLYENGDYPAAVSAYETLVGEGNLSPDLFYNLGAAKEKLGESGEGILWMRRALVLEPGMPESLQSLAFLRTRLAFFEFAANRFDRFIASLPPSFGIWAVSLCLWSGLLAFASGFGISRLRPNRPTLVTLGLVLLMTAFVASRVGRYRDARLAVENFATVTKPDTSALTAPAPDAKAVVALPPGSEVRLLQSSGAWSYVEIPGDLRGWIRRESLSPVWPLPPSQKTT